MSSIPPTAPKTRINLCAAVATWSFGALAIEECVPLLLGECSAVDAVEKGIMKVRTLIGVAISIYCKTKKTKKLKIQQ